MANWVKEFLQANPDVAAKPVAERGQFHYAVKNPDNSRTYYFTESPQHYYKDGEWKPLDTKLVYFADTDEYGAEGIATRIKVDGTVRLQDQAYTHKTARIGSFNPTTNTFTPVVVKPSGTVSEDTLTSVSGNLVHKFILKETGLREYLILNSAVAVVGSNYFVLETEVTVPEPQDPTITCPLGGKCIPNPSALTLTDPAYVCESDGITPCTVTPNPDLNKQLWPDGWVDDTTIGKYKFPAPIGWDATGKAIPIKRYAKYDKGKQYLYTGVQAGSLTGVTYPVTIDPDFSDMTADGFVTGTNATYSTARSTSTAFDITGTTLTVGQATGFNVYRGFLKFNTLTLPSAATITQVNIKLTATTDNSTQDFDVQIVKQNWSAQDPLSEANREAAYDGCLAGTADSGIWRNTSGMSVNTPYTSENLDTTYPTKGGFTYYSLRSSRDFGNNQPSSDERVTLAAQENATAAYRPVLVITATTVALADYTYSKLAFLDTSSNAGAVSTDQSQFPVALHIKDTAGNWDDANELGRVLNSANTDGKRLNYYEIEDKTWPLSYEVEYFLAGTTGEAVYWLGMPTVYGSNNTDTGTAESGTASTLTDTDKSWTTDEWDNFAVKILSGTGSGQIREITSNTATALTVTPNWDTNPSSDSVYQIGTGVYVGYEASSGWPASDQSNKVGVWDSNFKGVWHLGDNSWGSSPEAKDSTSNAKNGTNNGSTDATGQVRKGRSFDGTDDKITFSNFLANPSALSGSMWFNSSQTGVSKSFLSKTNDTSSAPGWSFYMSNGTLAILFQDTGYENYRQRISTSTYNNGAWRNIGFTYNSGTIILYVDGSAVNGTNYSAGSVPDVTNAVSIISGEFGDGSGDYLGYIDESRISDITRSADWIKLEYYSMKKTSYNGDTGVSGTNYPFVSWGSEVGGGAPAGPVGVKTINNITLSNTKKINNVEIANVKTINNVA